MIKRLLGAITARLRATPALPFDGHAPGTFPFPALAAMADEDLQRLNDLLPWSSWVVDSKGRRFGNRYSAGKRSEPELIPDPRILELNLRFSLAGKRVTEVGCFEGNHTVALCTLADHVTAVDSRIENVVKTSVRCMMASLFPRVVLWDVECEPPDDVDLSCDVLHHVGVLYHLRDPISHIRSVARFTREAIMLDTHVAPGGADVSEESSYRFWKFPEHGRNSPFAGMYDHAKWLVLEDLVRDPLPKS